MTDTTQNAGSVPAVIIDPAVPARYGDVKIAYLFARNVTVAPTPPREKKLARQAEADLRARLRRDSLAADPLLASWSALAEAMNVTAPDDQPAQLQLISRILGMRDIPKINNIVDAANITAAKYRSPVGVFDLGKINGTIRLRLAQPGETMVPLFSTTPMNVVPGEIVYTDDSGIFSRYSKDADRTRIDETTRHVFAVVDGTNSVPIEHLLVARESLRSVLADTCGPDVEIVTGATTNN